jgi:hypothetical protein
MTDGSNRDRRVADADARGETRSLFRISSVSISDRNRACAHAFGREPTTLINDISYPLNPRHIAANEAGISFSLASLRYLPADA